MLYKEQLVEITATDGLLLPALFYQPIKKSHRALILLHGNGSSSVFKEVAGNSAMAHELSSRGVGYLALNNRGANYVSRWHKKNSKKRVMGGMAYELIRDCVKDIDGAINFLRSKGYREFYLIGFSTGANKICVYDFYKKNNKIKKYILVGGADDSGIYYKEYGKKKFNRLLAAARKKIKQGKGKELAPLEKVNYIFSWQSLFDILNPDGAYNSFPFHYYFQKLVMGKKKLFNEYSKIEKPCLIIYGERDPYAFGLVPKIIRTLMSFSQHPGNKKFVVFRGGDHGLSGQEKELARAVANWLAR